MSPCLRGFALAATLAFILPACHVSQPAPAPVPSTDTRVRLATPTSCDNRMMPPGMQFPQGFDYPQTSTTVQGWVNNPKGDGGRTRLHAYCVFWGLNQPVRGSDIPIWRTWGTATQAFPNQYNTWLGSNTGSGTLESKPVTINESRSAAQGKLGAIRNPPPIYYVNQAIVDNLQYRPCLQPEFSKTNKNYKLRDGQVFQSNGDIMIAAVSYNQPALKNILQVSSLYDAPTLNGQLPAEGTPSRSIAPFPDDSIVLKVMLWPVNGGGPTWNAVTALPVWDWSANMPGSPSDGRYAGYEMQNFWTNAVAISSGPRPQSPGPQRVQFLYGVLDENGKPLGPNTYDNAQVVGLDRFYTMKFSDAEFAALSPCDRAILDASAYWAYNRAFQVIDSLVLIAMHVMTKEQSDWTFQSAWWHPDALACTGPNARFCGNQPGTISGLDKTYENYMMSTTYGMLQREGHPNYHAPLSSRRPPKVWPVAYNPYIELAASHPITTNCMNCHHRAAWPPDTPKTKPYKNRFSAYLQKTPLNPNPLEFFTTDNRIFHGLLMVDSMWAVSDRAGYPASRPTAAPAASNAP
jgi:hypothetical protein